MTNEAIKVELTNTTGFPRRFTVASNASIAKGTLLSLFDPRTASYASYLSLTRLAGIASMEKENNDYSTSISVWTDGIFELVASGSITVGDNVIYAGDATYPNTVKSAGVSTTLMTCASAALIIGYALETAADAEVINVRVRL